MICKNIFSNQLVGKFNVGDVWTINSVKKHIIIYDFFYDRLF